MFVLDIAVQLLNTLPDAARFALAETPLLLVFRVLALLTGGTLYEDISIGN